MSLGTDRRRVVVTGLGVVSPYGVGRECYWDQLSRGTSGLDWISLFDVEGWPIRYAGEVTQFDHTKHLQRHPGVSRDRTTLMALVAGAEALDQARLLDEEQRACDNELIGAVLGSGLGPCFEAEYSYGCYYERSWKAVRPTTVPKSMFNAHSSNASIYFGLRGGNHVIATACASGTAAIGHAQLLIRTGAEDLVLCGGADSPLCRSMFAAWTNMRVMAYHDEPAKASRPFDKERKGLALSEGAAMVVLEELESATRRGVKPLAEVLGYGASSDAQHITSPSVAGQVAAMQKCLKDAHVDAGDVDYINAHGTGTVQNDRTEAAAISEVFGTSGAPLSSNKSMLGHSLGASGALEFVACVQGLNAQFIPPTINCDQPDPACGLDYVPHQGRSSELSIVMSNSFAFGGNNSAILIGSVR